MDNRNDNSSPRERVIRIFVSSTFTDMQEERDELVKRTFPELRRLCESRGVIWSEVDLRWGITDEQKSDGQVLPLCLAEIQRCRPFFLGLLGERYGWVPETIASDLLAAEPWLAHLQNRSVTELEILHGVLGQPDTVEEAFFYFRSPKYLDRLPARCRAAFRDDASEAKRKLAALKQRIRDHHREGRLAHAPREDYASPQELADIVRRDLRGMIDRLFPEGSEPDPLARMEAEHRAWARSRQRVYVPRAEYFRQLDQHANGDGKPMVVVGESGAGKTALLANWARRFADGRDGTCVIQHYVGATSASTDWTAMIRRLIGELNRHFGLTLEIPTDPKSLPVAFARALSQAAAMGRVFVLLDGLNQLDDRDNARTLHWLPAELPTKVRLLVSTLAGPSLDELRHRGWPMLTVTSMSQDERRRLVPLYLGQYGKSLSPEVVDRIVAADSTANPLYLRVLLEELRVWGRHETLLQRLEHYLPAGTLPELFGKVFVRWEDDYEGETDLVGDLLSLLVCARRGLSEHELMALLGTDGSPLPRAALSPLLLAAGDSLVDRSGLLGLSHDFARQAVEEVYLPAPETRRAFHRRIADYFRAEPPGPRRLEELPWQLAQAGEWERLADLLADPQIFLSSWTANPYDVRHFWAGIEAKTRRRATDTYAVMLETQADRMALPQAVSKLLRGIGHHLEAHAIEQRYRDAVRAAQAADATKRDQAALGACRARKLEFEQVSDIQGLLDCLREETAILRRCGRNDEALEVLRRNGHLCQDRRLGLRAFDPYLDHLVATKATDEAFAVLAQVQAREPPSPTLTMWLDLWSAQLFTLSHRVDEAMAAWERLAAAFRLRGQLETLAATLETISGLHYENANPIATKVDQKELERFDELVRLCDRLGDLDRLKRALHLRYMKTGRQPWQRERVMAVVEPLTRLSWERNLAADELYLFATTMSGTGPLETRYLELLAEEGRRCRARGDYDELKQVLRAQAEIWERRGDLGAALGVRLEEDRIVEMVGSELSRNCMRLRDLASLLTKAGRREEALERIEQRARLAGTLDPELRISEYRSAIGEMVEYADQRENAGDRATALRWTMRALNLASEAALVADIPALERRVERYRQAALKRK